MSEASLSGTILTIVIIFGCMAASLSYSKYVRRRALRSRGMWHEGGWQNDRSTFGPDGGGHHGHHGGGWDGGGGHHGGGGGGSDGGGGGHHG
jgi:hypothetical protein